jgi:signal transduction histidine kinase
MSSGTRNPRVRTIFLLVNLVVLLIPLGGIGALRLYQTELIRRTEAELISQGALLQSVYSDALMEALRTECARPKDALPYGLAVEVDWPVNVENTFRPIPVQLELNSDRVWPPAPEARASDVAPEPCASMVGERLEPILFEAQKITLSGMYLLDFRGQIVATTQASPEKSLAHRVEVRRALGGQFVQLLRRRESPADLAALDSIQRRGQVRVYVAMPVIGEGRVVGVVLLVRTPEGLLQAIYKNRWIFGGFFLVIALAMVLISLLTSWMISRPLEELIGQTRRVASAPDEVATALERPGTREVAELSEAFADTATALRERSEYVHTFAQSVSHEFKTPLTSMQGAIELLEDHLDEMADAERDELLGMLQADTERMRRLVERLLLLARADILDTGGESIVLEQGLGGVLRQFETLGRNMKKRELKVEVVGDGGGLRLAISEQAFASVMANLLDNAQQHGAGAVRIEVSGRDEWIEVAISDDGEGISAGNAERVFESFFTTRRATGGTGLGLSIVRSLLRAHGAEIELMAPETRDGQLGGAGFLLRFRRGSG